MSQPSEPGTANFDRVARPYRWMEYVTFGRSLERCRNYYVARLGECRNALLLGDGDGRFVASLLAANPGLRVDAVDSNAAMLDLLERRANFAVEDARTRLRTHHSSVLDFAPERNYDLVATHFFLDSLTQPELDSLCARVAANLLPGALWVFSDFRIPAGAVHGPARGIVRLLYFGFRLLTGLRTAKLPDHFAAFTAASFTRIAQHHSVAGLLTSELWEYTPAMLPPQRPRIVSVPDPVPNPEPASPSLSEPDPGVFHREPHPLVQEHPKDVGPQVE